jgi:predicted phosphodiesterase
MQLEPIHSETGTFEVNETNDVVLFSDLHLADGRREPFGKYTHGENFFWDESFARFLKKLSEGAKERSQTLVSNGDFLDFLRVDRVPLRSASEDTPLVLRWRQFLFSISHPAALDDLYSVDTSESVYGFKTQDHKCVWKLLLIFEGHTLFFTALREFILAKDNRLILVRGNHDAEFYWDSVCQAFVYFLADGDTSLYDRLRRRVTFCQQAVVLNQQVHIEHGHAFDPLCSVSQDTLDANPKELLLSVGSLFNRYVINKIEEIEPLFDNIKPSTQILKAIAFHYPGKMLAIMFRHLRGAWRMVRKWHLWYATRMVGQLLGVGIPVFVFVAMAVILYSRLESTTPDGPLKWVVSSLASLISAIAVGWVQMRVSGGGASSSLLKNARDLLAKRTELKLITFGHTHGVEMSMAGADCWYVNSGTWIPQIDTSTSKVQDTDAFCVLRLTRKIGGFERHALVRWNDTVRELEPLIIFSEPEG